jgi:hypothetical protein
MWRPARANACAGGVFLLKLESASGKPVWRQGFGLTGATNSRGLALHGADNAILFGTATGTVDFGGEPLVSTAITSMFLAKFKR